MSTANLGKIVAHNCIKNGGNEKEIGLKYGILCKETAIYAEIKSNTPGSTEIKHLQIEIQKELIMEQDVREEEQSKSYKSSGAKMKKLKKRKMATNICAMPQCAMPTQKLAMVMPSSQATCKSSNISPPMEFEYMMPAEDACDAKCIVPEPRRCDEQEREDIQICKEMEEEDCMPICMPSATQIQSTKSEEMKAPTIQAISKVGLSSIIESQKISGLWEVASVVIQLQKSEDVIKNSIPENIKGTAGDQALSAWATIIMLVILYKKYSADQSKWKLIANKAIGKLKSLKIVYANYQADAEKLI
jgi:hypothetical protein